MRARLAAAVLSALALAAGALACARDDLVATLSAPDCPNGQCPSDQDAGLSPGDASAETDGGPADLCPGPGPTLVLGDGRTTCGSAIAERTFHFAVCTCTDLVLAHRLDTDAFDSTLGPYSPAGAEGGSVGVNGRLDSTAPITLGGSLWVGGAGGITAGSTADLDVRSELADQGPLASSARVTVGRSARVNGRLAASSLDVGETLTLPVGAELAVSGAAHTGALRYGPVEVAPPCACEAEARVDVPALVARHQATNDDARIRLAPDALADVASARTLELPCGRYALSRIGAHAPLHLVITGRVALFVGGDVSLDEGLEVELGPDGELDLFVAGNLVSAAPVLFGAVRTPARARLYLGGGGTIQLSGGGTFAGNLYAPGAELVTSAPLEIFGSVFARRIAASAPLTVHYDTAVLHAGDGCDLPSTGVTCTSCGDCPNVACTGGVCGACVTSEGCCAPLFCVSGRCEAAPL